MRMAFLVNRVETEIDEYATTRLAKAAALMGHEVWYIGLGDVRIGEPDGEIGAHARLGIARDDDTLTAFVDRMKESSAERIRLGQARCCVPAERLDRGSAGSSVGQQPRCHVR